MPAPTFVAAYNSSLSPFADVTTPQTASITTQAGDVLVIYAGDENSSGTLNTPTGNSLTYNLQQSQPANGSYTDGYIWTTTDPTGGTNWTLSMTNSGSSIDWGFTCLVFRSSNGIGASNSARNSTGTPSVGLTTTQDNSALVVFNGDWNAANGSSRTWLTVNSITPTNGNGLETTYAYVPSRWTAYGAYYNDAGAAGSVTVGLSAPSGQQWTILAVEVLGTSPTAPILQTNPVTSVGTTTATGNGSVNSDGGATVTERGFVWSTSPNPTTSDNKVTASGTTGSYNASLTGLSSGTLYHVRAYATNSVGTGYGIDVTFQNLGASITWVKA